MAVLLIALSISTKVTFLLLSLMLHCYVHDTYIISSKTDKNWVFWPTTTQSEWPHSKQAGQFQSTSERCAKRRGFWSCSTIRAVLTYWHLQINFFGGVRCGLWSDNWSLCFKTPWGWKSGRFDCSVAPWFHVALWCHAAWGLIPRFLDWSCW